MSAFVKLDKIDKKLLQLAQDRFPITKRPWTTLGNKLKITEEEVLLRLKRLYTRGIVRKIGPILDAKKLGLNASTLIAMKIPEDKIEEIANIVNEYKSVSHNYLRENEYNLWFTVTAPNKEELRRTIKEIKRRTGISGTDILDLPTIHRFKIDVRFRFTSEMPEGNSYG